MIRPQMNTGRSGRILQDPFRFLPGLIYSVGMALQLQTIGRSNLTVARLAYGCMRYVGTWNPAEVDITRRQMAFRAIDAALAGGYTLFDHADIYCHGMCETVFGEYLADHPDVREKIVIATKCGIRFGGDPSPDSPHRYDFSEKHILWSCEQSLKRLKTDYIDIYQLHRPDLLMNPSEVAGAFDQLHRKGMVRWFGVSNFLPSFVASLQSRLPYSLVVNQVEIHLGRLAPYTDGTLDQCIAERITPLAWSPIGGGFLGEGGALWDKHPRYEAMKKLQELMDQIAARYGVSRTVIALAWLLKHPSGIIPIVGSAKPAHIDDALKADKLELDREDWYRLLVAARGENLP